jgi:hypothetical protein
MPFAHAEPQELQAKIERLRMFRGKFDLGQDFVYGALNIEIHCNPDNQASATIPRKLGFTHEATLHHRQEFLEGELRDLMIWTLFQEDYPHNPAVQLQIKAFDVIGRTIIE